MSDIPFCHAAGHLRLMLIVRCVLTCEWAWRGSRIIWGIMGTVERAGSRITLLQFLRVVPSSAWLRSSIL